MRFVLRLLTAHHRRLAELLRAAMPSESIAFLLCRRCQGSSTVVYLVDDVVSVSDHEYLIRSPVFASISPSFMASMAQRAKRDDQVIVMVHIHPMTQERVGFSEADYLGNARSFPFFLRRTSVPEHLALVWNANVDECEGLVYCENGKINRLDSVCISDGNTWIQYVPSMQCGDLSKFDRQARMLGSAGQRKLGSVTAAIVGVGGTGSLSSLALVHHGVRRFRLIDDELIDETNLHRVPGSKPTDSNVRRKVDVAADYLLSHAPDAEVARIDCNVEHRDVLPYLIESDLIIVCTDNTTSRAYLNQVCQQYLIPMLDLGVQFSVDATGTIANEIGRINLVRPSTPCLLCTGHISPVRLAAESMPREERNNPNSYLRGLDDPQPSMLAFNMEVVGRGVQVLIGYLTGLLSQAPANYEQRTFVRSRGGAFSRAIAKVGQCGCLICGPDGVLGKGDAKPMLIVHRAV